MLKKRIELLVNKRKKELEEQRNKDNKNSSGSFNNSLNKVNKFGKTVSDTGNLMQKSNNTAMQNFGGKMSDFGNAVQNKTNINGMMNKALSSNAGTAAGSTAANTAVSNAGAQTAGTQAASTAGAAAGSTAASSSGGFNPWIAIAMLVMKNIEKSKQMRKNSFENSMNTAQQTSQNNLEKAQDMINQNSDVQMQDNTLEQNDNNELADSIINEYKNGLEENTAESIEKPEEQQTASNIFNEFLNGYKENRNTAFSPENLKSSDKSAWNRIGEAFGTTGRFLSKPAVQGAIAGTIYGLDKQNFGAGLKYGYDWAANKARSDMYNKMITGNDTAPVLSGNLTNKDYTAKADADYKQAKNQLDTDKQTFDQQHKTDELNAKKENYQNQWEHWNRQNKINEDKLIYDTLYKNGMLDIAQQNADTNAGKLSETITHNRNTEALARYNAENNAEYRNNVLALRQAELDYKQSENQGFTPSQKIQQLNKVLDARIKLIDNTDYSVLGFTEQDAELQKKEQKQEVINRYINDMNKLNNQQIVNNAPISEPAAETIIKPITERKYKSDKNGNTIF